MSDWTGGDWRRALVALDEEGEPHVLVTIVTAHGSTPRPAGTKMVVAAAGLAGTIGGGALEGRAIDMARQMLAQGSAEPRLEKLALGPDLDQLCGGALTLLFEPLLAPALRLALFGAGHVGRALVRVLDGTDVGVLWIDERAAALAPPLPGRAVARISADPAAEVATLAPGTHVRVMTHGHDRDYEIVAAALARSDLGSIGVIGSKSKWGGIRARLLESGVPEERVASVLCPIGLPGIAGKRPAEIALSVAAQLLQMRP